MVSRIGKRFSGKVSSKGQITLPAAIRRILGIAPGDRVSIRIGDGVVGVWRSGTIRDHFQSVPALDPPRTWEEIPEIIRDEAAERFVRKFDSSIGPEAER